jgi:hypothetical protein
MSKYVVGWFMVFNPTFNNISVKSWWSVLLVEETRVPGENHQPTTSYWQTLSHNAVSSIPCMSGIQNHNFSGDSIFRVVSEVGCNTSYN